MPSTLNAMLSHEIAFTFALAAHVATDFSRQRYVLPMSFSTLPLHSVSQRIRFETYTRYPVTTARMEYARRTRRLIWVRDDAL